MDELIEDCLIEIFTRIPDKDLGRLSQCCWRFNAIANKMLDQRFIQQNPSYFEYDRKSKSKHLRRFGKHCQALKVSVLRCGVQELRDVFRNCPSVTRLTIRSLASPKAFSVKFFQDYLEQLTELNINLEYKAKKDYSPDIIKAMERCTNLEKLTIGGKLDQCLQVIYPKMHTFAQVQHFESKLTEEAFTDFCKRNQSITSIALAYFDDIYVSGLLELKNLRNLDLGYVVEHNLDYLPRLTNLKTLDVRFCEFEQSQIDALNQVKVDNFMLVSRAKEFQEFMQGPIKIKSLNEMVIYAIDKGPQIMFNDCIEAVRSNPGLKQFTANTFDMTEDAVEMSSKFKDVCTKKNITVNVLMHDNDEVARCSFDEPFPNIVDVIRDSFC